MKAEVRNIKSIKLIPDSDSDRAVLAAMSDMAADETLCFHIQSHTWGDGEVLEMCVGFTSVPAKPG